MKTFEDLFVNINNSNYVADNYNKLLDKSKVESVINSIPKINYNDDYMKDKLGRSWKCVCHHIYPIISYLYYHKSKLLPIQLPSTTLSIYNNYIIILNTYLLSNIIKVREFKEIKTPNVLSSYFDYLRNLNVLFLVDDFKHFGSGSTFEYYKDKVESCSYTYILDKNNIYNLLQYLNNLLQISYNPYKLLLSNSINQSNQFIISNIIKVQNDIILNNVIDEISRQKNKEFIFRYYLANEEDGKRAWAPICSEYPSLKKKIKKVQRENKKNNIEKTDQEVEELIRNDDKSIIWREDIFDEYFGKDKWIEWDRNASIYNITYSYNKKKYRPNSEKDWYAIFNGKDFDFGERDLFKLLCMTLYFSDVRKLKSFVRKTIIYATKPEDFKPKDRKEKRSWKLAMDKDQQERWCALMKLSGALPDEDLDTWVEKAVKWYKETRQRMKDVIGDWKNIKENIFLLEGAVNLATMNDLIDLGYKAVSVYDGFYTNCINKELIEKIYKDNTKKYLGVKE